MGINLKPNEDDDVPTIPVRDIKAGEPAGKTPEKAPCSRAAADPKAGKTVRAPDRR